MRKEYGELGFRNLHGFNSDMLWKQGWKLSTNPGATITTVFKAKYFPNENCEDAQLGHNLNYTWHSIHAS